MASDSYLSAWREVIEEALKRNMPHAGSCPAPLLDAMNYALFSGGKRLRPILALIASEAVQSDEGDPSMAIQAAVAIEMLHTYTLIHDDLPCMDDDTMRRGQPTVHVKFGEDLAVLAGDALQALAFDVISRPGKLSVSRAMALVHALAGAAGPCGVVGGQVEDLSVGELTEERLAYIQIHKTGDLFRTAMMMGAIAGGGDEHEVAILGAYGENLGIAFQIVDDILDKDEKSVDEETTCLRIWPLDKAKAMANRFTTDAVASLSEIKGSQASAALSDLAEKMLHRIA